MNNKETKSALIKYDILLIDRGEIRQKLMELTEAYSKKSKKERLLECRLARLRR